MSTTTIRLSDELKQRVARAAEQAGVSPHSFILDAIAQKAEQAERQAGLQQQAESRYARMLQTGRSLPWAEMRAYLLDRAEGGSMLRPPSGPADKPVRKTARKLAR
jgi:predicted transcriptional regulator